MWSYNYTTELYHHGVLGMRWGVRRYQNRDGTLTNAGKKRAAKLRNDYEKVTGKHIDSESGQQSAPSKAKTVKQMTDEELRDRNNRLMMEKNYLDLQRQINSLTPQHVSAGKKVVQHLGKQVIVPAATNAGKTLLTSFLIKQGKKALQLDDEKSNKKKD